MPAGASQQDDDRARQQADGASQQADGARQEADAPRQLTWGGAVGEVWRSAVRHKLVSALIAVCVAGSLIGIALAGSGSGAAAKTDPMAPAFRLPALAQSGQQVSLSSYAGKPLIVNFFASWCGPCQKETPLLATFYRDEHGRVAMVGLDENDVVSNALSFTRAKGVGYPVGFDPQLTAASAYGVGGLPQTFFLDAKHRIVDRVFGAVTLAELNKGIALATGSARG
jgi:cytochrome c biogenesis protein CcmG/thiol:disulfide interchange protein DsbE